MGNKQSGFSRRSILHTGLVATALAETVMGFPTIMRSQQAKTLLKPIVAGLGGKGGNPTIKSIAMIPEILGENAAARVADKARPQRRSFFPVDMGIDIMRTTAGLALTLLGGLAVVGSDRPAHAQNALVVAGIATAQNLDGDITQPGTIETVVNVYEGLVEYGVRPDANGVLVADPSTIRPHLAESWVMDPDGKTVTFTLRRGVKSSFGTELTARDIVFGWEKSRSQKRFGNFVIGVSQTQAVEEVAPDKVKFTLANASRVFLPSLYTYAPAVIDSKTAKENATSADPFALDWLSKNTAGFGAYRVVSRTPGEGMVWEANPQYFGDKPFYSRIIYREVPSAATRASLIRANAVQWAEDMPIEQVTSLQTDRNVRVERVDGTGSAYLAMNPNFPPFNDVRVRRAIIHATDYEAIGKVVFRGTATRVKSLLSPSFVGHTPTYGRDTDFAQAKKLLIEAGHPNGLKATLEYSNRYWWEEGLAVQMKDSLAKAGIDLEIKRITAAEVLNRRVPGTTSMPFFSTSINSIVLDSGYKLLAVAHSKGVANWNAYSNPKLDATIDALLAERDDARYASLVGEAQRLFAEDAVYVDTFYPGIFAVMHPCIRGWVWQPHERTVFRTLRCT